MRRKKKKKSLIERIENKKIFGFTLIELLAVIIILGVLMIIAIPSVTEYIQTSRKNSFIVTAQSFIDGATTKVNSMEYDVMDVDATYYLPTKCISFEKGGESPFGEFEESYVVVTYDGKGYDYYYTGRDSANHGIVLTYRELLDESFIETGMKTVDLDVSVGNRPKIIRYNDDCNKSSYEELVPTKRIEEEGTLRDGSIEIAANEDCFNFSNGKITGYRCNEGHVVIPEYIRGEKVTAIGEWAFESDNWNIGNGNATPIYTITIPKTVTTIEDYAIDCIFLYNIVNLTDKEFNWGRIVHDYNDDNYFETGTYIDKSYDDFIYHKFEITKERVSYDLTGIFEVPDDDTIKVSNKRHYRIDGYVFDWDNYEWVERENIANGEMFDVDCRNSIFSVYENNETLFVGNLGYECDA